MLAEMYNVDFEINLRKMQPRLNGQHDLDRSVFAEKYVYDASMGGPGHHVSRRSSGERSLHRDYVLYKPRRSQRCSLARLRFNCCRYVLNINRALSKQ